MKRIYRLLACTSFGFLTAACAGDAAVAPDSFNSGGSFARVGPPTDCCYHDGTVVRTVVPPASMPNQGRDNLYAFTSGGADGQLTVIGTAPGQPDYHGGNWAFHSVTWNVTPYLITSDEQLLAAAVAGDVTITRVPANDFRCPIQP